MIYLLGGASRAGKTSAAHRFTARSGVSHFSVDYLKMGLFRGRPDLGVDLYDDQRTAQTLWPILRGMIQTYIEETEDILMEGYYLLPSYVAEVSQQHPGQVRSCFMGFCDMPTPVKIREMKQHSPAGWLPRAGDWSEADDEEIHQSVEHLKSVSRGIRQECERSGLRYVEVTGDRDRSLDEVVEALCGVSSAAHMDGPWYHGSPGKLSSLRAGSMVTPFVEIAKAFSHKPKLLSMSEDMESVKHNGETPGFLYVVAEEVTDCDLIERPDTRQTHWEIRRDLRVKLVGDVPVDDPPLLTGEALRRAERTHTEFGTGFHEHSEDDDLP